MPEINQLKPPVSYESNQAATLSLSQLIIILAYTAYENVTERSETSACKIQTPGNYPKESIQH